MSSTNEEEEEEERTHTDRQAVEDDVFVGRRRGACRQGNGAVVAEAEGQALAGRGLEVVGPRGPGGLQVERLQKNKTSKR